MGKGGNAEPHNPLPITFLEEGDFDGVGLEGPTPSFTGESKGRCG